MVDEGKGRLFRRKDGKFLIYLPLDLCTDSQFPWKLKEKGDGVPVKVAFSISEKSITVTDWTE